MSDAQLIARAAAPLKKIISNIRPDQLGALTPCTEFDVRGLVNHLLFYGPSLEAAGRKESVPPPAESSADIDLTAGDWAAALIDHVDRTVSAWSEPSAWEGDTYMGGPMRMPAFLIGGMVVGELVVHGWDLARATGQDPVWDDDLLAYVYAEVDRSAEQGREMGIYGPEVPVPADAPMLDRVLGRSGRDPAWTP